MKASSTLSELFSFKTSQDEHFRFFSVTYHLYSFGFLIHGLLLVIFLLLHAKTLALCTIFTQFIFAVSFFLNQKGRHNLAFILVYFQVILHTAMATHFLGWESGFYQYLILFAPLIFFNPQWSLLPKLSANVGIIAAFSYLFMNYHEQLYGTLIFNPGVGHFLLLTNLAMTVIAYSLIGHYYSQANIYIESRLHHARQAAETIAHTDSLTGLMNRRAMIAEIELEVSRAEREGLTFTLALCDIDDFKLMNDQYGHEYGDKVLVQTSQILQHAMRRHDKVARWGGEEFLILLPNTTMTEGHVLIERLRETLANSPVTINGEPRMAPTMTFGLCHYITGLDIKECLQRADEALYCGKRSGKNRTVLAQQLNTI